MYVRSTAAVAGPKEGRGPLGKYYDHVYDDNIAGEKTFEKAERAMMKDAALRAIQKAGLTANDIDFFLAGDLLNQVTVANFTALKVGVPFLGLYGACSTSAESLALGSVLVDSGAARHVVIATSSHNDAAERQYRYPTEYGYQRRPYAQWTVTGSGAAVLSAETGNVKVTGFTAGRVHDAGVKEPYNLGAAMAPAAADTIITHLNDFELTPGDYDLILTGDLGKFGTEMLFQQLSTGSGVDISKQHRDCGLMIYDRKEDVHAGGSGCASSALVVFGYVIEALREGELKRVLLVATGALHSPTTFQQGENIPSIAHAVILEREE